jgi:hypothetical protein
MSTHEMSSSHVRASLDHPVIDGDGHTLEVHPAVIPYVGRVGGADIQRRFEALFARFGELPDLARRRAERLYHPGFWMNSARSERDRATCYLPSLLASRLPELGYDFMVVYPSLGLGAFHIPEPELRRVFCRALNTFHADVFREHADRMTPAMVIPLHDPDEGISELDHVVGDLGMKVALIPGFVERPLADGAGGTWLDHFGIDSACDYDPFWQAAIDRKVALATHQAGISRSVAPSNFVYGHIGHFATSHFALAKALLLGGVTRRFPRLRLAFLEGGVGWGLSLYADLCGHWEKRNRRAVQVCNPDRLDPEVMAELFDRHARGPLRLPADVVKSFRHVGDIPPDPELGSDDFAACGIEDAADLAQRFAPSFFFGCEADDRLVPVALAERSPVGVRLAAFFGSDLGHWDAPDITAVLHEAHEQVDRGFLSPAQFRDFTFANAVRFYAGTNPAFFDGTSVGEAARAVLRERGR